MATVAESQKTHVITRHRWVTLGLILALLLLRYSVTLSRMLTDRSEWQVLPAYEVGTYLLVAVLLVWESHALPEYHIQPLAIWMIILFKPLETVYQSIMVLFSSSVAFPMAIPGFPSLCIWIIAVGLLAVFRSQLLQKGAVSLQEWNGVLVGGLLGLAVILVTAYPESFQIPPLDPRSHDAVGSLLVSGVVSGLAAIPYQIGYAAVSEEPVFRGFLWGYLRKSGWREVWIWLFQAGLFVLAHLHYVNTLPILFWFTGPLCGLVFGWLAWRSRSIATSMAAHGVVNGLSGTVAHLVAATRL